MTPVPITIVREDARVEDLGLWHPDERALELFRPGFPFLAPGRHVIERDLPWIFWDMCPSGYLGARFAREFRELALPEKTELWDAEHCLRAISNRGEDLTGNLIVGAESKRHFFELAHLSRTGQRTEVDAQTLIEAMLTPETLGGGSSVGGDRPKVVIHGLKLEGVVGQVDAIVKFSPPLGTPAGERWKSLLEMEALVRQCLREFKIAVPTGGFSIVQGRATLSSARFDRTLKEGRRGAATLSYLAASRDEADLSGPEVLQSLHRDGLVDAESVRIAELVHSFSLAIGNNDAHLGNYGLAFDAQGKAELAPIYDVSPMIFAPRFDELPDSYVKPRHAEIRPDVVPMVEALVKRARSSPNLAPGFLDLWLRYIGA